jgi:hypothetical protein
MQAYIFGKLLREVVADRESFKVNKNRQKNSFIEKEIFHVTRAKFTLNLAFKVAATVGFKV